MSSTRSGLGVNFVSFDVLLRVAVAVESGVCCYSVRRRCVVLLDDFALVLVVAVAVVFRFLLLIVLQVSSMEPAVIVPTKPY